MRNSIAMRIILVFFVCNSNQHAPACLEDTGLVNFIFQVGLPNRQSAEQAQCGAHMTLVSREPWLPGIGPWLPGNRFQNYIVPGFQGFVFVHKPFMIIYSDFEGVFYVHQFISHSVGMILVSKICWFYLLTIHSMIIQKFPRCV